MIIFSSREIAFSVLCALVYGCCFSVFSSLISVILGLFERIKKMPLDLIKYEKITSFDTPIRGNDSRKAKLGEKIFNLFLFTVGFILLSYLCLDGILRVYMLFICSASFYLSKIAFSDFLSRALILLFDVLYRAFTIIFRVFFYPIFFIARKIRTRVKKG